MKKALLVCSALSAASFALSAAVWSRMPDRMPVHWGIDGQPDRFGGKVEGLLLLPALILVIPALLVGLLRLSPRRDHLDRSRGAVDTVLVGTAGFVAGVHALAIQAAVTPGGGLDGRWLVGMLGILFVVLGNVMPKVRSNWFIGIRTPWTLDSERTWTLTHRFGGWVMTAGGALVVALAVALPVELALGASLAVILAASLAPVVYSWWVWTPDAPVEPSV